MSIVAKLHLSGYSNINGINYQDKRDFASRSNSSSCYDYVPMMLSLYGEGCFKDYETLAEFKEALKITAKKDHPMLTIVVKDIHGQHSQNEEKYNSMMKEILTYLTGNYDDTHANNSHKIYYSRLDGGFNGPE
jgi:hypothetical protein